MRFDAELEQSCDRGCGVVRMDRRRNQVPGLRGLKCDLGCLAVTDLADENDVGVLA
jgi:hypothetical protein